MDRHFPIQNIFNASIILVLTLLFGCGPRSGIHDSEKTDDNIYCGTQMEEKKIDVSYNGNGGKLFKQNCAVCHSASTDQIFVGPSLKGMPDRLPNPPLDWFMKYTINNEKVFLAGDSYAVKLRDKYKDSRMPVFEGILSEKDVTEIYEFLTGLSVDDHPIVP